MGGRNRSPSSDTSTYLPPIPYLKKNNKVYIFFIKNLTRFKMFSLFCMKGFRLIIRSDQKIILIYNKLTTQTTFQLVMFTKYKTGFYTLSAIWLRLTAK